MANDTEWVHSCRFCGSSDLIETKENVVCEDCASVQEIQLFKDYGPRAFSKEEKEARSHHAINNADDFHTLIGSKWDAKNLNVKQRAYAERLKRMQVRSSSYRSKRHRIMIKRAKSYCTNLFVDYSQVRDKMDYVCKKLIKEDKKFMSENHHGMFSGRSVEAFTAALLLGSARGSGLYLLLDEVVDASKPTNKKKKIWKKELFRAWKMLRYETDVLTDDFVRGADPINNIPRWCAKLELPNETEKLAVKLYRNATSESHKWSPKYEAMRSGGNPNGPVAGAIYLAGTLTDEKRTQKEVANLSKMTEVTLRKYAHVMKDIIGMN